MIEEWKPVVGYEWHYEISNIGRVKSFKFWRETMMSICNIKNRSIVRLSKNWIINTYLISRLVAKAFIPNPLNLPCACHKDETLDDKWLLYNWADNLWWGTQKDNMQDMFNKWRKKILSWDDHPTKWIFWKGHPWSKKVNQYTIDWELIKTWDSGMDIQRDLWVNQTCISNCCLWKQKIASWFIWRFTI